MFGKELLNVIFQYANLPIEVIYIDQKDSWTKKMNVGCKGVDDQVKSKTSKVVRLIMEILIDFDFKVHSDTFLSMIGIGKLINEEKTRTEL